MQMFNTEKDLSLILQGFKQAIFEKINENNLPPAMIYYCMKDIMRHVEQKYQEYINMALQETNKNNLKQNSEKDQEE